MTFRFVGPNKQQKLTATQIECFNKDGNLTILPGHKEDIFLLKPNSTIIVHLIGGTKEEFSIDEAVLEITREEVTCLVLL